MKIIKCLIELSGDDYMYIIEELTESEFHLLKHISNELNVCNYVEFRVTDVTNKTEEEINELLRII